MPDAAASAAAASGRVPPKSTFAAYEVPDRRRSVRQVLTTIIPLGLLWATMLFTLDYGYWLTLLLAVPTAGFLMRLFLIQHDCVHRSFLPSGRANDVLGCVIGLVTLTPHYAWRRLHLLHHATSGNLDRRGHGDIDILTVTEYLRLSPRRRFLYRFYRHPLVLFGIGPILHFVIKQRFCVSEVERSGPERVSVYATNAGLLTLFTVLWLTIGIRPVLLVHLPVMLLASSAGVWLFYVQHQFEQTYWETGNGWDYVAAAMQGSSYYALPRPLQWLTCHIGLHHIHHLSPSVPNYRLQECLDENPELQRANRLTLRQSLRCASLKLWDEDLKMLVP